MHNVLIRGIVNCTLDGRSHDLKGQAATLDLTILYFAFSVGLGLRYRMDGWMVRVLWHFMHANSGYNIMPVYR